MSITIDPGFAGGLLAAPTTFTEFANLTDYVIPPSPSAKFTYSNPFDIIVSSVNETANDGSAPNAYASIFSEAVTQFGGGTGSDTTSWDVSRPFFAAHQGTTITFEVTLQAFTPLSGGGVIPDGTATYDVTFEFQPVATTIQNDYLGVTRTPLPLDQATTEANAIIAGTTTENQFFFSLLPQVEDTTIPAVAVEGSMYGTVGTSDEITKLTTQFLPSQVAVATQLGLNAQVYACETLGLAFAFGNENGGTGWAQLFGPSGEAHFSNTADGDASFATAAANAIFGQQVTASTPGAIAGFVANWKAFYTSFGLPGMPNATPDQIDLAARGAAWGDAVGVVLASNHVSLLSEQTINFLADAAQGNADYGGLLANQVTSLPFEGADNPPTAAHGASQVQLTGVAAPFDHIIM